MSEVKGQATKSNEDSTLFTLELTISRDLEAGEQDAMQRENEKPLKTLRENFICQIDSKLDEPQIEEMRKTEETILMEEANSEDDYHNQKKNKKEMSFINYYSQQIEKKKRRKKKKISLNKSRMQIQRYAKHYSSKMKGLPEQTPPRLPPLLEIVISSVLAFAALFIILVIDRFFLMEHFSVENNSTSIQMVMGACAASTTLLYHSYQSPLAQPRNVLGSYTICSFLGVSTRLLCDLIEIPRFVAGALAVALSIIGTSLTNTVHPPGGACALLAVMGGDVIENMGYGFVLTSMGAAFILISVAVLGHNLFPSRQYPLYWK